MPRVKARRVSDQSVTNQLVFEATLSLTREFSLPADYNGRTRLILGSAILPPVRFEDNGRSDVLEELIARAVSAGKEIGQIAKARGVVAFQPYRPGPLQDRTFAWVEAVRDDCRLVLYRSVDIIDLAWRFRFVSYFLVPQA